MREILIALLLCVGILTGVEIALHRILFTHVSYSNSESVDRQLEERNTADDWNVLFIGNSETRWGIDPFEIDAAFFRHGIAGRSFNHAFDGFGPSWWSVLLPPLLRHPSLKNVRIVVLGVQMIDAHRNIQLSGQDCGALQRPVLMSAFAADLGVDRLCRKESWDATLSRKIFSGLWTVRYASAVRALLLPNAIFGEGHLKLNSRKEGDSYRGFESHRSIAQDLKTYPDEVVRWKAQNKQRDFKPLPHGTWQAITGPTGFFCEFHRIVRASGRKLALFALPTNPVVIDTLERRDDYRRNAELLRRWAAEWNVLFVDFGIQDVDRPTEFFSDVRHLSGTGARSYSRRLGEALATSRLVTSSLSPAQEVRTMNAPIPRRDLGSNEF